MKKLILASAYSILLSSGVYLFAYKQGQIDMMQSKSAIFNICDEDCYLEMSVRKVMTHRLPASISHPLVNTITYWKEQFKEPEKTLQASAK